MKKTIIFSTVIILMISCSKEEPKPDVNQQKQQVSSSNSQNSLREKEDGPGDPIGFFEWNGISGPGFDCWPISCDCALARVKDLNAADRAQIAIFDNAVKIGKIRNLYQSNQGMQILRIPGRQLSDILKGITTFKEFPPDPGYHLVYKGATNIYDRPAYK